MAVQAHQGARALSRVGRIRSDSKCADDLDQDSSLLPDGDHSRGSARKTRREGAK